MSDNTQQEAKPLDQFTRATQALTHIFLKTEVKPVVGIILGSGLGNFASQVENADVIPYDEIPGWPLSTVEGHSGKLVLGTIAGVPVAVMQGRVHAYEGYEMNEVVFPMRVLGMLGCKKLIVTNAAGGINTSYGEGALVNITDHINNTGRNAAIGPNDKRFAVQSGFGQRFFDMSNAYSPRLNALAKAEAARQGIALHEGVYMAVLGPSYETPAEIRAFRTLGADLVGMSTVHEVIIARHMGIEVLGFSLVTNMAAGVMPEANINHEEVMQIGKRLEPQFASLVKALVPQVAAA
ncbi:purine-nucleoside phosphorylase [Granulicella cerasi]|uniref:Purine nucleoside phosphorylase n=1 Tax=Granulicella cerasi TaxID=741063 RepID=A0ABW1Z7R8_9BACT|nr:purine-nucleoside phosphorylase [Granulicella cerasi]